MPITWSTFLQLRVQLLIVRSMLNIHECVVVIHECVVVIHECVVVTVLCTTPVISSEPDAQTLDCDVYFRLVLFVIPKVSQRHVSGKR